MKKLIALFAAVFFVFALTGVNAWAADPEPENPPIDRHAVWTKIIDDNRKIIESHKNGGSESSDNQSAQASSEDHVKMEVRIKDLPWQRVG